MKSIKTVSIVVFVFTAMIVSGDNAVMTYQGRVQSGGANFTGMGHFKFALVTGTNIFRQATASANVLGSQVDSITLIDGGAGYVDVPTVVIDGTGAGAWATAIISGGEVVSITVNNGGLGYGALGSHTDVFIADPPTTTFWSNDGSGMDGSEPFAGTAVTVDDGLFTVGLGDTGLVNMQALDSDLFSEPSLQLRIWFNDGTNGFSELSPTQPLTAAPYALKAWSVSADQITGTIPASNIGEDSIDATMLVDGAVGVDDLSATVLSDTFWGLGGNSGTTAGTHFIGSTDNEPVEIHVNGKRALRIEPNTYGPVLIGGHPANSVGSGSAGAVIAGGGWFYNPNTIGMNSDYSAIGGGYGIDIGAGSTYSTVSGGSENDIGANSDYSTIAGGYYNKIGDGAQYAFAAGRQAKANHSGSFVWGDSQVSDVSSTTTDQMVVRARNGFRLTEDAGVAKATSIGDHYRDNAVIAWGKVSTTGSLLAGFGVSSVARTATGQYRIDLSDTAASIHSLIPVAMAEIDGAPSSAASARILSIDQNGTTPNYFHVYINNGNYSLVDNEFVFIVTGR